MAGPLLGGALTSWLGWRAVFWASVPVCVAALLGLRFVADSRAAAHHRLDVAGQIAGTVCLAALVGALIDGPPSAPVGLAVSAGALCVLIAVERRAAWPMLDPRYFRDRGFTVFNLGAGLMNLGVLGSLFVLSLLLQHDDGLSPAAAGVRIIPLALPLALIPPFASRVIRRSGPRLAAALGLAGTGAGFLGLAALDGVAMVGPLLLSGISLGFATPALVTGATESVPVDRAGMAAAVNNTARQTGGAVGVALIGGVAGARGFAVGAAALLAGAVAVSAARPATRPRGSAGP